MTGGVVRLLAGHGFAFRTHHVPADNWPGGLHARLIAQSSLDRKPSA